MMNLVTGMSVFDLRGGAFLALYGWLLLTAVVASIVLPHWLRPADRAVPETDPDALAYLAGGKPRMAESLVAELLEAKALVVEGRDRLRIVAGAPSLRPANRAILGLSSPASWNAVSGAVEKPATAIEQRLVRAGLLIDAATATQLRLIQALPFVPLIGFGAIKWQVGVMRDKPVGFLTAMLVLTAVIALFRLISVDRRTKGGMAALASTRERFDRLRRAPTAGEAAMAVALFGTAVLAGSARSDFHRMRTAAGGGDASSSGDAGGGDGGGDGGSGCGGGCGGCGS